VDEELLRMGNKERESYQKRRERVKCGRREGCVTDLPARTRY
jgi:hypothetical protein